MTVNIKTVTGRRHLSFRSLDEVVADADKLVTSPNTRVLGNWPLGQLLSHLTMAINQSIDGFDHQAPWFIRLLAPLFKKRFLTKTMSAGFNLPQAVEAGFFPPVSSRQQALQDMRKAVARLQSEKMTAKHPVLGKLTHDEWLQLHLRHSELHLSFAVPG